MRVCRGRGGRGCRGGEEWSDESRMTNIEFPISKCLSPKHFDIGHSLLDIGYSPPGKHDHFAGYLLRIRLDHGGPGEDEVGVGRLLPQNYGVSSQLGGLG